ncbi:response regulator [Streptomyces massasporeus]|uniref:response regulator n=1 Tax=Streptomyces massasporeus TaxID=67324 RepID=UPI0037ADEDE3
MRIPLVEDDEPVAESPRRGLGRYGFEVEWVTTGGAAYEHAGPYDVVLLDLGLPDTDGLDVCTQTLALPLNQGAEPLDTLIAAQRVLVADASHRLLAILGWSTGDLEPQLPPRVAFGGAWHPVIATASRDRLADLDYDMAALGDLMARRDWTTIDLVLRESPTVFHARNPFPPGGVPRTRRRERRRRSAATRGNSNSSRLPRP